ncbi:MAG: response regulator [Pseudomonadota bacterium]
MTPDDRSGLLPASEVAEIGRQHARLTADLPSRQIGVALTCLIFAFFLPLPLVAGVYAVCVAAEILQHRLARRFLRWPTRGRYRAMIGFSSLGMTAFVLLPLAAFYHDDPIIRFAGVLALMGALLNVSIMRATHLMTGLLNGLPPAAVLLWYPGLDMLGDAGGLDAPFAFAGVLLLLGYFLSALIQNHRQEAQLALALDRAHAASEAKSRFLSAMSHEMRTPLNAILGLSQVLRGAGTSPAVQADAAEIERSARHLQSLVEDVLDLAHSAETAIVHRPVTGALRDELEVAMRAAVARHCGDLRAAQVDCSADLPELARFDPLILRKIVDHLTGFLCAARGGGPDVTLRLDCRCSGPDGRSLALRLSCAGDPVIVDTAPEDGAGGVALALAQRLAAATGGRAGLAEVGGGGGLAVQAEIPVAPLPEPPPAGKAPETGLRALVVDDIATNRFVVLQILRTLGIAAQEAASGREALARLMSGRFDLILLDMAMPDMDGEATLRAIRAADAGWNRLPVVALTADASPERREAYLALGLDGYVAKPVDRRVLWSEIQGAIAATAP